MMVWFAALTVAVLFVFTAHPADAEKLTVNVTAHVTSIYDPDNVLGGQVSIGEVARGRYSYETTVPDRFPSDVRWGSYSQSPQQGHMIFSVGPFTVESNPSSPDWVFFVEVNVNFESYLQDTFMVSSYRNKPLPNGAPVWYFDLFLEDRWTGRLWSDALFTSVPDLTIFPSRQVQFSGGSPTGGWYQVVFEIDTMEVASSLLLSPGPSSFIRAQHIQPAVLRVGGVQASDLRGSVNGTPLPASYLEQCSPTPLNGAIQIAMACPNIVPFLNGGANEVEWSLDLVDGSTVTSSVAWEILE